MWGNTVPDDPRVQQLLDELLDSHGTPEEVCGSCPEMLPQVRERWRQLCRVRAELDALFPPATDAGTVPPAGGPLPTVPGYEVEAVLGCGGMGVVFRARHQRLNRVVALKMAATGAYAGPQERVRFQREAEAIAALHHPNVVQIHDSGDADGRPYFTMEYVEGGSLAQKLDGTPRPARDAASLLVALAGAVQAAHDQGIVHRDLKPANVLLAADGTPKVGDFGLARRLGGEAGLTRPGTAVGTPSYMAPEQARGTADLVGPPADIYALGAVLYEVLTGRPPFRAETAEATVQQLLHQDPVPPSRLNRTVPRDLETVCLKCLSKDARFRYSSAAALADDLSRFLRGESVTARPESPAAPAVPAGPPPARPFGGGRGGHAVHGHAGWRRGVGAHGAGGGRTGDGGDGTGGGRRLEGNGRSHGEVGLGTGDGRQGTGERTAGGQPLGRTPPPPGTGHTRPGAGRGFGRNPAAPLGGREQPPGEPPVAGKAVCRRIPQERHRPPDARPRRGGGTDSRLGRPRDAVGLPARLALLDLGHGPRPGPGGGGRGGRRRVAAIVP